MAPPSSFDREKHRLAKDFLTELDIKLCDGRIAAATAPFGGVRIRWNSNARSRAGSALTRCMGLSRSHPSAGPVYTAEIMLSSNLVINRERLYNVLAHEFCHVLTGIFYHYHGHGKPFKKWGRRAEKTFPEKNIKVTTCHSYPVDYRYIFRCTGCYYTFRRQYNVFKSGTCGRCHSRLVQIKGPVRKS